MSKIDKNNPSYCLILTTCDSKGNAENIAKKLVGSQLAACVNILDNVTSIYSWQGSMEKSLEFQLIIKTHTKHISAIEKLFSDTHNYELPEFVIVKIDEIKSPYGDAFNRWIGSQINITTK